MGVSFGQPGASPCLPLTPWPSASSSNGNFPLQEDRGSSLLCNARHSSSEGDGDRMYKHQGPRGQKGLLPDRGQEASDALGDSAGRIDVWGWGRITDIRDGELG